MWVTFFYSLEYKQGFENIYLSRRERAERTWRPNDS